MMGLYTLFLFFTTACLHGGGESGSDAGTGSGNGNGNDAEERAALAAAIEQVAARAPAPAVPPEDAGESYFLVPRDYVRVEVYGHEDLSTTQRLDGSGRIRMSLIGTVNVAGMSIRDAEARIEERYREERYLRNPEVTITVEEYAPRFVSVLGNVEAPGRIEFPIEENRLDIVDLISKAGGFTRVARADRVRLIRINEEGREETVIVDVQEMMQGRDRDDRSRVYVYPGDSVFVPERLF